MKTADKKYLIYSKNDGNEEYFGLAVIAKECVLHAHGLFLLYDFHDNNFYFVKEHALKGFLPPSQITACMDECFNEYRGKGLQVRIKEAIKAYEVELPSFIKFCNESPIPTDEVELSGFTKFCSDNPIPTRAEDENIALSLGIKAC
jgi:hypothetical protein